MSPNYEISCAVFYESDEGLQTLVTTGVNLEVALDYPAKSGTGSTRRIFAKLPGFKQLLLIDNENQWQYGIGRNYVAMGKIGEVA